MAKRSLNKTEKEIRKSIRGSPRTTNKERDEFPYFRWIPKYAGSVNPNKQLNFESRCWKSVNITSELSAKN
jgi:hypothetical protein